MKIQTFFVFIVLSYRYTYAQDRRIISILNPGCQSCTNSTTLVYIRAEGSSDTIHQIWDFTQGIPTIVFGIGSTNSSLEISWYNTTPKKFFTSEPLKYSFALAFDKLYEYNDTENNGQIDHKTAEKAFQLRQLKWTLKDKYLTNKEAKVVLQSPWNKAENGKSEGFIGMKLDLLPYQDYAVDLPHLIHTANSTQVDVSLVNLTSSWAASRFALHATVVASDDRLATMRQDCRKSLDDEHTPGVFEIIEIKTPALYTSGQGGYIQFRPVAYTQAERGVTSSTVTRLSQFNYTDLPRRSTLESFYHEFNSNNLLVQDMFVSFGESGDGFYAQHNYTAWAFTIGYGAPPTEGFSLFVLLVISIGLGVPVLLALSGVIFLLERRKRQRNLPTMFEDE